MEIVVPWPDKRLSPNRSNGRFWGAVSKLRLEARERSKELANIYKHDVENCYEGGSIELHIVFYEPNKRRRDIDGMLSGLKPTLDGIADGFGVDDYQFGPIILSRGIDVNKVGFVKLTFIFGENNGKEN